MNEQVLPDAHSCFLIQTEVAQGGGDDPGEDRPGFSKDLFGPSDLKQTGRGLDSYTSQPVGHVQ